MKKTLIVAFIITIKLIPAFSQNVTADDIAVVSHFIQCVKYQKKDELALLIEFPLKREYPIPDIKNKEDLFNRYNEVFDDSLIRLISFSKPTQDWSKVGWRGILFSNGAVWLDEEGKLIALNYQSQIEKSKRVELIRKDKNNLHSSIKNFEEPIYLLETDRYRIRIDDLGSKNYRYTSWSLTSNISDRPELIVEHGEYIWEGTGGNHRYEFINGDYTYECDIVVIGEDNSPPALLNVYKHGKLLISQKAKIIRQ